MDSSSSSSIPISPPPTTTKNNEVVLLNTNAAPNLPSYAEMIYKALSTLNEKDGSSRTAIGKYIEEVYNKEKVLPPSHPILLNQHLNHLKNVGLLVLVNNSNYKLPPYLPVSLSQPAKPPVVLGLPFQDPVSRRRGRPPGSTFPNRRQAQTPKTQLQPTHSDVSPVPKRGRGRRPKKKKKNPKEAKAATMAQNVVDEDLRRKFEHFQSKVKKSLLVLKPYFNDDSPVTTIVAIKELEILATLDLTTPLTDEPQQFPEQQRLPPPHLPLQKLLRIPQTPASII